MYVFSTKLNTEKRGCSGFAGIIRFHPPNLPNSRSILGLLKNGTDAELGTVDRADAFAERCADCRAVIRADARAVVHAELRTEQVCRKRGETAKEQGWF